MRWAWLRMHCSGDAALREDLRERMREQARLARAHSALDARMRYLEWSVSAARAVPDARNERGRRKQEKKRRKSEKRLERKRKEVREGTGEYEEMYAARMVSMET
jgi:hypothetical protein